MSFRVSRAQGLVGVSEREVRLVGELAERWGRVTVVVPRSAQRDLVRRGLSDGGVSASVDVMTMGAWIQGLWELFGSGEHVVDALDRRLIMTDLVHGRAQEGTLDPLGDNPGTIDMLCGMAAELMPYILHDVPRASLSASERRACELVRSYAERLERNRMIEQSEACVRLARRFAGAVPPCARAVVVRSARTLAYAQLELLECVGDQGDLACLFDRFGAPLAVRLAERWQCEIENNEEGGEVDSDLGDRVLFAPAAGPSVRDDSCIVALEACFERAHKSGVAAPRIAIAAPDPLAAYRRLVPRLASRGFSIALRGRLAFGQSRCGQQLGQLMDLLDRMEHAEPSSWWPAPELADWIRSPLSGMGEDADRVAIAFDTQLRKKRSLTVEGLKAKLSSLESRRRSAERDRSKDEGRPARPVVLKKAIDALADGSAGRALMLMGQAAAAADGYRFGTEGEAARDSELAMVGAASSLFARARVLGVSPELAAASLDSLAVPVRWRCESVLDAPRGEVEICRLEDVACAAGAFDACVIIDASASSYPLARRESAVDLLAVKLGAAPISQAASALQRSAFVSAIESVRWAAALTFVARDSGGDELYPALAYAELEQAARSRGSHAVVSGLVGEDRLSRAIDPASGAGSAHDVVSCLGIYELSDDVLPYVQPRHRVVGGQAVERLLSASQTENYLACPYRWFVSNRVPARMLDAGFGPIEFGNFAHDVMQRFHERLTEAGLERVIPGTVDECLEQMDCAFDEMREDHARGKYTHGKYAAGGTERPRPVHGALVALDELERNQIEAMRVTFHNLVRYESDLMPIYTPREFEYSFDKEGIEYAGRPLGGRIDRIDVAPSAGSGDRFVVIDYKNRSGMAEFVCPDPTMSCSDGEGPEQGWLPGLDRDRSPKVQTLMYATAYERLTHGQAQGAVYLGLRGPSMAGAVSSALTECEPPAFPRDRVSAYPGNKKSVRGAQRDGEMEFSDLLRVVEESIASELDRMEAGCIAPCPTSDSCTYCPLTMCEMRR